MLCIIKPLDLNILFEYTTHLMPFFSSYPIQPLAFGTVGSTSWFFTHSQFSKYLMSMPAVSLSPFLFSSFSQLYMSLKIHFPTILSFLFVFILTQSLVYVPAT